MYRYPCIRGYMCSCIRSHKVNISCTVITGIDREEGRNRRRTAEGFVEATFHIPENVMKALKMRAVQENKRFSKVAEDALSPNLSLTHETSYGV